LKANKGEAGQARRGVYRAYKEKETARTELDNCQNPLMALSFILNDGEDSCLESHTANSIPEPKAENG